MQGARWSQNDGKAKSWVHKISFTSGLTLLNPWSIGTETKALARVTETCHHIGSTASQDRRAWLPGRVFCLTGRARNGGPSPTQFAVQTPPNKGVKTLNHSTDKTGGRKKLREAVQEPPLLPEKFPSSHPATSMRPLAPGCRRKVTSAPSQPGTPPNRHLAHPCPYLAQRIQLTQ